MQKQQGWPDPAVIPHGDLHTVRHGNPNVLDVMRSSHAFTLGRRKRPKIIRENVDFPGRRGP
ncbi:hypothetical protein AABB02_26380 [Streptomyces rimosus]|uniref:hypothetical protein n=1 Tax=Streptomyces rimosus TaxID=1927 RepID=UPI0031DB4403